MLLNLEHRCLRCKWCTGGIRFSVTDLRPLFWEAFSFFICMSVSGVQIGASNSMAGTGECGSSWRLPAYLLFFPGDIDFSMFLALYLHAKLFCLGSGGLQAVEWDSELPVTSLYSEFRHRTLSHSVPSHYNGEAMKCALMFFQQMEESAFF